jgi:hypothetical protein
VGAVADWIAVLQLLAAEGTTITTIMLDGVAQIDNAIPLAETLGRGEN